jgi:hypothetical protein
MSERHDVASLNRHGVKTQSLAFINELFIVVNLAKFYWIFPKVLLP